MKIILDSLQLVNFKGIKQLTVAFDSRTDIHGNNATGKTTLVDAFLWLLFNKDSSDRATFEIKTLDESNRVIPKIDHEVVGVFTVGDRSVTLKKVLKEKWVKKRGNAEAEFQGNETLYFWNDVPMAQNEYQKKVGEMIDERLFKLITNVHYFNSIKWQERRQVLVELSGGVEASDIEAQCGFDTSIIRGILSQGKTIVEYRRELGALKKRLNDQLAAIPTRIDEAYRSMPEELDYGIIRAQYDRLRGEHAELSKHALDLSQARRAHFDSLSIQQKRLHELTSKLSDRKYQIQERVQKQGRDRLTEIKRLQESIASDADSIRTGARSITVYESDLQQLESDLNKLRQMWADVDAETLSFDAANFCCPTCQRELEAADIEAKKAHLTQQFNTDKSSRLERIERKANEMKQRIADTEARIKSTRQGHDKLSATQAANNEKLAGLDATHQLVKDLELQEIDNAIATDPEIAQLNAEIASLSETIESARDQDVDTEEIQERLKVIADGMQDFDRKLQTEKQRQQVNARIEELKAEEKKLAEQLAGNERSEYQAEQYVKAQMSLLESRVNAMFRFVKFRMFKQQVNGGEEECCDALIGGVPFSDANNAAQINAGLDIINTLSNHYGVHAPIFIDNAESVVKLIDTSSQIVRLVVDEAASKLTVQGPKVSAQPKQGQVFA